MDIRQQLPACTLHLWLLPPLTLKMYTAHHARIRHPCSLHEWTAMVWVKILIRRFACFL
jgi:hypothetical protein